MYNCLHLKNFAEKSIKVNPCCTHFKLGTCVNLGNKSLVPVYVQFRFVDRLSDPLRNIFHRSALFHIFLRQSDSTLRIEIKWRALFFYDLWLLLSHITPLYLLSLRYPGWFQYLPRLPSANLLHLPRRLDRSAQTTVAGDDYICLYHVFFFDPFVSMSESFHWNCHSMSSTLSRKRPPCF